MDKLYKITRVNRTEIAHFGNIPDNTGGISIRIDYSVSQISINNFVASLLKALYDNVRYADMHIVTLSQQQRHDRYFQYHKDSSKVSSVSEKKYTCIEIIGTYHDYVNGMEDMYQAFESAAIQSAHCLE